MTWHAFELRPAGSPPISPAYRARIEQSRPRLAALLRDQHGVTLNNGPFGIDSRPALIAAKVAEAQGVGPAFHDAVFRAYWLEARHIGETDVLGDIAEAVGLARAPFTAALADPQWEAAVAADIAFAHNNGLSAVPALVFAMRYLVSGAQPLAVLRQVVEQVSAETTP